MFRRPFVEPEVFFLSGTRKTAHLIGILDATYNRINVSTYVAMMRYA